MKNEETNIVSFDDVKEKVNKKSKKENIKADKKATNTSAKEENIDSEMFDIKTESKNIHKLVNDLVNIKSYLPQLLADNTENGTLIIDSINMLDSIIVKFTNALLEGFATKKEFIYILNQVGGNINQIAEYLRMDLNALYKTHVFPLQMNSTVVNTMLAENLLLKDILIEKGVVSLDELLLKTTTESLKPYLDLIELRKQQEIARLTEQARKKFEESKTDSKDSKKTDNE